MFLLKITSCPSVGTLRKYIYAVLCLPFTDGKPHVSKIIATQPLQSTLGRHHHHRRRFLCLFILRIIPYSIIFCRNWNHYAQCKQLLPIWIPSTRTWFICTHLSYGTGVRKETITHHYYSHKRYHPIIYRAGMLNNAFLCNFCIIIGLTKCEPRHEKT